MIHFDLYLQIDVNLFIHTLGLHVWLNSLSKISIYTFCNTILFNTVSSCIWVLFIWFATKQFVVFWNVNVIQVCGLKSFLWLVKIDHRFYIKTDRSPHFYSDQMDYHFYDKHKWSPVKRDYPLNLSILLRGGQENNYDALSNGEWSEQSSSVKSICRRIVSNCRVSTWCQHNQMQ